MRIKERIIKVLKWSQQYTKADMVYIGRHGFWVIAGQFLNGFLSFVLLMAFANLLPKETYGAYRYILSLISILNIFTLSGMNTAVSRAVALGNEGVLESTVVYQLKWNVLMLLASLLLSGYYAFSGDNTLALSIGILGIFTPLTLAFNTYGPFLEGKKQFALANTLGVFATSVYTIGAISIILLGGELIWMIAMYAATTFVSSLASYLYTMKKFRPQAVDAADTISYGRTLTYIRLLGPITSQIDKIIVAHFWGAAQLATYALATAIPSKGIPALKKIVDIGFPKLAMSTPEKINILFYKRIFQGLLIGTFFTILYILVAPYLFKYLLPQYTDGIFYSQILSLSFIFAIPTRYVGLLFGSQRMSRSTFINDLINSLIAIFLFVAFASVGGVMGLCVAVVAHSFLGLLVNIISWRIHTNPA